METWNKLSGTNCGLNQVSINWSSVQKDGDESKKMVFIKLVQVIPITLKMQEQKNFPYQNYKMTIWHCCQPKLQGGKYIASHCPCPTHTDLNCVEFPLLIVIPCFHVLLKLNSLSEKRSVFWGMFKTLLDLYFIHKEKVRFCSLQHLGNMQFQVK